VTFSRAAAQTPPTSNRDHEGATAAARENFLRVLGSQVGVMEKPPGSNWGPEVSRYLASCGITKPAPWCAAFLHWAFAVANHQVGGGAWSPAWFPRGRRVAAAEAVAGDIGGVYFASINRIGHVVAMVSIGGDAAESSNRQSSMVNRQSTSRREVATIEGNTNAAGSREGDRVARKVRDREQLVYSRWTGESF
jgi:hypothetical protein